MRVPDTFWDALCERGGNQIGMCEGLAVVLLLHTFKKELEDSLVATFIDNKGNLGSLLKGGSISTELNIIAHHVWLEIVYSTIDVDMWYVQSKATISDGPSREDYSDMASLGAKLCEPQLPVWATKLWDSIAETPTRAAN